MDEIIKKLGESLAEEIAAKTLEAVQNEINKFQKQECRFCYTEKEAAEKLNVCSATLYNRRIAGEISYTTSPSGKPVYLPRHIDEYLHRGEVRAAQPNK